MKTAKKNVVKKKSGLAKRGYTFVELIIILSILLILVVAAVLTFVDLRAKARNISDQAVITALQAAINTYYAKFREYPGCPPFITRCNDPSGLSALCHTTCTTAQAQIMKYPPSKIWNYYNNSGDDNTWAVGGLPGTCYSQCDYFAIYCPHVTTYTNPPPPTKGYVWYYFPVNPSTEPWTGAGTNLAGKVLLYPGSPGH